MDRHPATMTEQQWNYVMITNSLLHALVFDRTTYTLQKARESGEYTPRFERFKTAANYCLVQHSNLKDLILTHSEVLPAHRLTTIAIRRLWATM
jgi:hypothetical protein